MLPLQAANEAPPSVDWRAYVNRLIYCWGCGRFAKPVRTPAGPKPPSGWMRLAQPHHDAPPVLLACGRACGDAVRTALRNGPLFEPLKSATDITMSAEMREAMRAEMRLAAMELMQEEREMSKTTATITILDNLDAIERIPPEVSAQIVADLLDRTGLDYAWDGIDPETRGDIVKDWEKLIDEVVRRHILSPEDNAMLQALYSRSPMSVAEHLEKVRRVGSGNFMGTFYKGYGHDSIGDCGVTTLYIEGVSMLAAKAIQDWPLYSGQEASTRYMKFDKAVFENPIGSPEGEAIQERWREFYLRAFPIVREALLKRHPGSADDDQKKYEKAIDARAFDICRGWLPAGAHTNLSWTTNLRQAKDKLFWMSGHPDTRIGALALAMLRVLSDRYKNSFKEQSGADLAFRCAAMLDDYFLGPAESDWFGVVPRLTAHLDEAAVRSHKAMFRDRPRGTPLPPWMADLGEIRSQFLLDFGSFRDLQRHRAGTVRMPMLTTKFGRHPWYFEQLPAELLVEAAALDHMQHDAIHAMRCDPVVAQNYVAMGYMVPCRVTQPLPAFVYRLELRSSKTVHPTLRRAVHQEIAWFKERFPHVALHVDLDEDDFTVKRGGQTIEEKS